jgi:hypothetical protein
MPPYGAAGFVHWQEEQGAGNPGTDRNKAPACNSRAVARRGQQPRQRLRRRVQIAAGLCFERRLVARQQLFKYGGGNMARNSVVWLYVDLLL